MKIYLMQHGLALAEAEDPNRPLSPAGKAEMEKGARAMKKLGIAIDLMVCSRKARAQETAAIVAAAVGYPAGQVVMTEAVSPSADVEKIFTLLEKYVDKESVLIVGHLPSLGLFAGQLLTGKSRECIDFRNGGLGRIDMKDHVSRQGRLRYYFQPEHLARMA